MLKTRRSNRAYTAEMPEDEKINEVLDAHQMVSAEYEFRFADGRIVTDRSAARSHAGGGPLRFTDADAAAAA